MPTLYYLHGRRLSDPTLLATSWNLLRLGSLLEFAPSNTWYWHIHMRRNPIYLRSITISSAVYGVLFTNLPLESILVALEEYADIPLLGRTNQWKHHQILLQYCTWYGVYIDFSSGFILFASQYVSLTFNNSQCCVDTLLLALLSLGMMANIALLFHNQASDKTQVYQSNTCQNIHHKPIAPKPIHVFGHIRFL